MRETSNPDTPPEGAKAISNEENSVTIEFSFKQPNCCVCGKDLGGFSAHRKILRIGSEVEMTSLSAEFHWDCRDGFMKKQDPK